MENKNVFKYRELKEYCKTKEDLITLAIDVKDNFIEDVKEIFGHEIPMNKLIELIESSPLKEKEEGDK